MTPTKMLNWLTKAVKDGQTTVVSKNSLFAWPNVQRNVDHIYFLNISQIYDFAEFWVLPSYVSLSTIALLIIYKISMSYLNSFLRYRTFRNPTYWLIESIMGKTQDLQQVTKYLRLTLVFMWNSAQREKFNFCFSRVFC